MTKTQIWHKYYVEVLVELPTGEIVEGGQARDGLIYQLPITNEVAEALNAYYPRKGRGWYFNDSFDRYIAEIDADCIAVNPRFIIEHCKVA